MTNIITSRRVALMLAGLCLSTAAARADILLLELDFDAPVIAAANDIVQLSALGGIVSATPPPTFTVNLRRHDHSIDGTVDGNNNLTFDNFFSAGNFLVLGDTAGNLRGDAVGTSAIWFPFEIPTQAGSLSIRYDWVFDSTSNAGNHRDAFMVDLWGGPVVQPFLAPARNGATRGTWTQVFDATEIQGLLGTSQNLRFLLIEDQQPGSSAVGIDNIHVSFAPSAPTTVPEPATLPLLALALVGLVGLRRRK